MKLILSLTIIISLYSIVQSLRSHDVCHYDGLETIHCENARNFNEIQQISVSNWTRLNITRSIFELPDDAFSVMKNLQVLIVQKSHIKKISQYAFRHATGIKKIVLERNKIDEIHQEMFLPLAKTLTELVLPGNNFVEHGEPLLKAIHSLKVLEYLDLSSNRIKNGLYEHDLAHKYQLPHSLKVLRLENNRLDQDVFKIISNLASLTDLYLDNNNIQSIEKDNFSGLTDLRVLSMSRNSISHLPAKVFFSLLNLKIVQLEDQASGMRLIDEYAFDKSGDDLVYDKIDISENKISGLTSHCVFCSDNLDRKILVKDLYLENNLFLDFHPSVLHRLDSRKIDGRMSRLFLDGIKCVCSINELVKMFEVNGKCFEGRRKVEIEIFLEESCVATGFNNSELEPVKSGEHPVNTEKEVVITKNIPMNVINKTYVVDDILIIDSVKESHIEIHHMVPERFKVDHVTKVAEERTSSNTSNDEVTEPGITNHQTEITTQKTTSGQTRIETESVTEPVVTSHHYAGTVSDAKMEKTDLVTDSSNNDHQETEKTTDGNVSNHHSEVTELHTSRHHDTQTETEHSNSETTSVVPETSNNDHQETEKTTDGNVSNHHSEVTELHTSRHANSETTSEVPEYVTKKTDSVTEESATSDQSTTEHEAVTENISLVTKETTSSHQTEMVSITHVVPETSPKNHHTHGIDDEVTSKEHTISTLITEKIDLLTVESTTNDQRTTETKAMKNTFVVTEESIRSHQTETTAAITDKITTESPSIHQTKPEIVLTETSPVSDDVTNKSDKTTEESISHHQASTEVTVSHISSHEAEIITSHHHTDTLSDAKTEKTDKVTETHSYNTQTDPVTKILIETSTYNNNVNEKTNKVTEDSVSNHKTNTELTEPHTSNHHVTQTEHHATNETTHIVPETSPQNHHTQSIADDVTQKTDSVAEIRTTSEQSKTEHVAVTENISIENPSSHQTEMVPITHVVPETRPKNGDEVTIPTLITKKTDLVTEEKTSSHQTGTESITKQELQETSPNNHQYQTVSNFELSTGSSTNINTEEETNMPSSVTPASVILTAIKTCPPCNITKNKIKTNVNEKKNLVTVNSVSNHHTSNELTTEHPTSSHHDTQTEHHATDKTTHVIPKTSITHNKTEAIDVPSTHKAIMTRVPVSIKVDSSTISIIIVETTTTGSSNDTNEANKLIQNNVRSNNSRRSSFSFFDFVYFFSIHLVFLFFV
jgi:hypothetical protein